MLFATSGRDALDMAAEQHPGPDPVRRMMPDMDGYEVCTRLKANSKTPDVPVIFVTAMDDEADETRGLEVGAIDYLSKPIRPAIVRARVRNHLQLKRYRDNPKSLSSRTASPASPIVVALMSFSPANGCGRAQPGPAVTLPDRHRLVQGLQRPLRSPGRR